MPLISGSLTPESLLPRSDSKNPATTCKGITSNGRPCRRSLATSPRSRHTLGKQDDGVLAVVPNVGMNNEGAAAYFCWQHKDQASGLIPQADGSQVLDLKERNSIDTLIDKLGVMEVNDHSKKSKRNNKAGGGDQNVVRKDTLPQRWQQLSGPLMSVPEQPIESTEKPSGDPPRRQRRKQEEVHLSFFCCMRQSSTESFPPARPRPALDPGIASGHPAQTSTLQTPVPAASQTSPAASHSQISTYLRFIPSHVPPAVASVLLSELAKPLTTSDREPGYIYIFWLTPTSITQAAASTASSLLAPPEKRHRTSNPRRTSDVLREFGEVRDLTSDNSKSRSLADKGRSNRNKTIMLKIGRASNVHRRMNEWTRQCGHHITLLRYYPNPGHRSPSPSPSPSPLPLPQRSPASSNVSPLQPRKAPLIPRVERLIHLELQDKRVMRACDGCGKEHREWFEVEASREGVKAVDECVRRWVGWAQQDVLRL